MEIKTTIKSLVRQGSRAQNLNITSPKIRAQISHKSPKKNQQLMELRLKSYELKMKDRTVYKNQ